MLLNARLSQCWKRHAFIDVSKFTNTIRSGPFDASNFDIEASRVPITKFFESGGVTEQLEKLNPVGVSRAGKSNSIAKGCLIFELAACQSVEEKWSGR